MVKLIVFSAAVGREKIGSSVIIVIRPCNRPGRAEIVGNVASHDFDEGPIPLIMKEGVLDVGAVSAFGYDKIYKAVIVVVSPSGAVSEVMIADDGTNRGRVGQANERAVPLVVIKRRNRGVA